MPTGEHGAGWEELAELDPYWAVLSDPATRFGAWDLDAFLRSGTETVAAVLAAGARFGLPRERADALDFGCGAGRLTYALAGEFERCLGVDGSAGMVARARELTAAAPNCRFEKIGVEELRTLDGAAFDLVLTQLVLQHVPPAHTKLAAVGELVRVLRPGGLLALQLPSAIPLRHRLQPRPRTYALLRRAGVPAQVLYERLRLSPIRMSALPRPRVEAAIVSAGGRVLEVRDEIVEGGVVSSDYLATRER